MSGATLFMLVLLLVLLAQRRVPPWLKLAGSMISTRAPKARKRSTVSSLERLSTTRMLSGCRRCATRAGSSRSRCAPALRVGMTRAQRIRLSSRRWRGRDRRCR